MLRVWLHRIGGTHPFFLALAALSLVVLLAWFRQPITWRQRLLEFCLVPLGLSPFALVFALMIRHFTEPPTRSLLVDNATASAVQVAANGVAYARLPALSWMVAHLPSGGVELALTEVPSGALVYSRRLVIPEEESDGHQQLVLNVAGQNEYWVERVLYLRYRY